MIIQNDTSLSFHLPYGFYLAPNGSVEVDDALYAEDTRFAAYVNMLDTSGYITVTEYEETFPRKTRRDVRRRRTAEVTGLTQSDSIAAQKN